MATYRPTYENFYTDKQGSYGAIGSIVPVLANQFTTSITDTGYTAPPGQTYHPPHYCAKGYLYCDGEEYNIADYPLLYDLIKNEYNISTQTDSLTNPLNNNSILFKSSSATTPGAIYRTFVDGGDLYCEMFQRLNVVGTTTYKHRTVPNNAWLKFVGGLGAFPSGGVFTKDVEVQLEYNSSYQDKATTGQNTTVHRFLIGSATETVDINWNITSSTLIQGSDPLPFLPTSYMGTVPELDPTTGYGTNYDDYAGAKNWSPNFDWSGITGIPVGTTVDKYEIYLENMSRVNRILWHVKNIPGTTTSFSENVALPTGAQIVKNTVDRTGPRAATGQVRDWVRTNGYSGPQPELNKKDVCRFYVIALLSNGQELVTHIDFTAGSGPQSSIHSTGNVTWSNGITSPGTVSGKTLAFDEDINAGRATGVGGMTFTPPSGNIIYNHSVEIYDPTGSTNTKSRVYSNASTAGSWVDHTGTWTTIASTATQPDGSVPTGTLHKIEFENRINSSQTAGVQAIRVDGKFQLIDVHPEPNDHCPSFKDVLAIQGTAGAITNTAFNLTWSSFASYTETPGGVKTLSLTAGGTGYTAATGVATTGGTTGSTGLTVDTTVTGGVITAVAINNLGSGYNIGDVITVTGGNSDARLTVLALDTIITGHPKVKVRKTFLERDYPSLLGKFSVPDYRDRKLIGMGEGVNGAGTPLVGDRSSAEMGAIGGQWTIAPTTIDNPTEFFTISDVVTAGYQDVKTQIQAYLTGEKKITIGPIEDYFFNRPAEHDHQLLHSVKNESYPCSLGGQDRFSTGYSNVKGSILDFEPSTSDGEPLGHSHGLLSNRPVSNAMSTYGNSGGVGDRVQDFSLGTLKTTFGNDNLPEYSDQDNNPKAALDNYYPIINGFDGSDTTYCDMSTEVASKWSRLTFGTAIANVTKIVVGYDGAAHLGYNQGNWNTTITGTGSKQDITLYNGAAITLNSLDFVTQGTPLAGGGTGYARLYNLKLTVGGTETEVKQDGTGCYKYKITEPPLVDVASISSDGTTVSVTTTADHGLAIGDYVVVTEAGVSGEQAKFNGTFQVISDGWTSNQFKYTPTDAPASGTTGAAGAKVREAAGYFKDVTNTPTPNVWSVDNLPTTIGGKPIYSNDPDSYGDPIWDQTLTSPNTFSQTYNSSDDVAAYFIHMRAPGGGGGVNDSSGGNGGVSRVVFSLPVAGNNVTYTITAGGGLGGQSGDSGGTGGNGGVVTITASDGNPNALLNDSRVSITANNQGAGGASGGASDESTPAGGIGGASGVNTTSGAGGIGSYKTTPASGDFWEPASGVHSTNGSWNATADSRLPAASTYDYIELEAVGGAGGRGSQTMQGGCPNPTNPNTNTGQNGQGGERGKGRKITGITGSSAGSNPSPQFATSFSWEIGQVGQDGQNVNSGSNGEGATTGGNGAQTARGGGGGSGAWGNGASGAGGGGATGIRLGTGGPWILGAGGGGGGGGQGGGNNGGSITDGCWDGGDGEGPEQANLVQTSITFSPFSSSQNGGSSGCTAGGGGGGGGGFGGTADGGEGGQAGAGHVNTGSGDGGHAGRSAGAATYLVNVPANSSEGGEGTGYVKFHAYYTGNAIEKSGGGGGAGAEIILSIVGDDVQSAFTGAVESAGSAAPGGSPTAAGNGGNGYVRVRALPITEGGQTIIGYTTSSGRVYDVPGFNTGSEDWSAVGTGSTVSKADIWHSASSDVRVITPANGTFAAMANHSSVPTGHPTNRFVRFTGSGDRFLKLGPLDLRSANELIFDVIKGTGSNGGSAPEEPLELKYNTDENSSTFSDIQQIATAAEGGNGAYFTKVVTLDSANPARTNNVYLLIKQSRPSGSGDNASSTEDEWGIAQFGIVYGPVTTSVFVPSVSAFLPGNEGTCGPDTGVNVIRKTITAQETNIRFGDGSFQLSSSTPISVTVTATPQETISLVTRYHRAKYLIKAF